MGSGPSLMWNRLLTTHKGWAQLGTVGAPAASGAAQSNRLSSVPFPSPLLCPSQLLFYVITASCTEKLTTGHTLLPHRWMGFHQYHVDRLWLDTRDSMEVNCNHLDTSPSPLLKQCLDPKARAWVVWPLYKCWETLPCIHMGGCPVDFLQPEGVSLFYEAASLPGSPTPRLFLYIIGLQHH